MEARTVSLLKGQVIKITFIRGGGGRKRGCDKKYPQTPQQIPKQMSLGGFCASVLNKKIYFLFLAEHRYSLEANQMQHECGCCHEFSSQTREVTLTCQNGTSINYSYVYVDQCQCMNACTSETSAPSGSQLKKIASYSSQWNISRRKR